MATNIKEIWKPVVNFEGLYEVSNLGRVRSVDHMCVTKGGHERMVKGRIRALCNSSRGYKHVNLTDGSHRGMKTRKVHQLVLEAFVGPKPHGAVCRHLDGNRTNNCLANLAWGTAAENSADAIKHGTLAHGLSNFQTKLTEADVRLIRMVLRTGVPMTRLALIHGVSDQTIRNVKMGLTWRHVG